MILQNYHATEHHFWRHIAQNTTPVSDRAVCYLTPLPVPVFNYIYLRAGADKADFLQAQLPFTAMQKPHCLVAESAVAQALAPLIQAAGYEDDGETAAMHLRITDRQPSAMMPAACEIREVNDQPGLWAEPLEAAFSSDDDDSDETGEISDAIADDFSVIGDYIGYHQNAMAAGAEMRHFVLLHEGEPVSCMTLTLSADGARIDDLGTIPAHQGKGYATLLLEHALMICRSHGVTDCFLEASAAGLALYQKLGFTILFTYRCFVHDGSTEAQGAA